MEDHFFERQHEDGTPVPKTSYVLKVPGQKVFVLAGYCE